MVYYDRLSRLFNQSCHEGAEEVELMSADYGEEQQRGYQRGASADKKSLYDLVETHITPCVHLHEHNHGRQRHRKRADDNQAWQRVGVVEHVAAEPQQRESNGEHQEHTAVEPRPRPLFRHLCDVWCGLVCAADEYVFSLFHAVTLKHIGEEHTPVEVSRLVIAHVIVDVVDERFAHGLT